MKTKLNIPGIALILATGFISIVLSACSASPSSSGGSTTKETWNVICNSSASNPAYITLTKNGSTVSVSGGWTNNDSGYPMYDNNSSGTATISGTSVTINLSGTATYPHLSASSPYTMVLSGTTSSGSGTGSYTITFTATGWSAYNGTDPWTATRTSGSGITE